MSIRNDRDAGAAARRPRAVFFDRDGVLNESLVRDGKPRAPGTLDEFRIFPEAPGLLESLRTDGFLLFVVTNQPDVGRGLHAKECVEAMHRALAGALPLDGIFACYHSDEDGCACRKPRPGFLLDAAAEHGLALEDCFVVGDRWRDIEAGRNARCRTIWIDRGYLEKLPQDYDFRTTTLSGAVEWIRGSGRINGTQGETKMTTPSLKDLKVKIYADGADKEGILGLYKNEHISGFTTNPSLMAKAGIKDYEAFAKDILAAIKDRPISFEVFSDDLVDMERQGLKIKTWGSNVYTKIPVINTQGVDCCPLVKKLTQAGVKLNVTAILTLDQVERVAKALEGGAPAIVSVFAGRIADTGRDPMPLMKQAAEICKSVPQAELLWASCRELLNIFQADQCGTKIITVPHDVLKKLNLVGKDLYEMSLDTVKTFSIDATKAGFKL